MDVWEQVKNGGPAVILLLLLALGWMNLERKRLLSALKDKSDKLESLSERMLVILTKVEMFLFSGGRK